MDYYDVPFIRFWILPIFLWTHTWTCILGVKRRKSHSFISNSMDWRTDIESKGGVIKIFICKKCLCKDLRILIKIVRFITNFQTLQHTKTVAATCVPDACVPYLIFTAQTTNARTFITCVMNMRLNLCKNFHSFHSFIHAFPSSSTSSSWLFSVYVCVCVCL